MAAVCRQWGPPVRDVLNPDDRFHTPRPSVRHSRAVCGRVGRPGDLDSIRRTVPPVPDIPAEYADDDWWAVHAAAAATDSDPFNAAAQMACLLVRIGEFAWAQANTMFISGLACVRTQEELGEMIRRRRRGDRIGLADTGRLGGGFTRTGTRRDASPWGRDATRLRGGEWPLLRDVLGNPSGRCVPTRVGTPAAVVLPRAIYEDRAFDRLPILADALQDAGCENDDVLTHCRGPGPHVRGCWVMDLVLGRG